MKSVLRRWRGVGWSWTIGAPRADADFSLVLVSPSLGLAWGLWPEPRTVVMSASYSIACNARLLRAAIVFDLD
jgi:hypothetical protein